MQYKKLIQSEIEFSKTFRFIAQAYEEIAVMKMRKVRNSVLSTRNYLFHLSQIFFELKKAKLNLKKQQTLANKLKQKPATELKMTKPENKLASVKLAKTVSVLLSANTTLYGDLIERIFNLFMKNVTKDGSDIIIVGRVGKRLYDEQENKKDYTYFELPDVELKLENLKPVIFHLVKYQKIMVYYGKFESVVTQKETFSNISGDQPPAIKGGSNSTPGDETGQYLFEPSLETILAFFEDLIASSLFRPTVHETQLARWASRIMSMEKAQVNIDAQIKKLHFSEMKIQRQDQNKKQLDRLAGLSLWRQV